MEFNFDFNLDTEEDKNRIMIPKKFKKPQLIKFEKAVEMSKKIVIEKDSHIFAIVSGNFIYGDLIEAIVVENNANILEMTISTLSMSESNINSLAILLENDYCQKLNLMVSEYFYSHEKYPNGLISNIYKELDQDNKFQLAVCGVHTKICLMRTEGGKYISIYGSANLRSSRNIEQLTIIENKEIYDFNYKWHMDLFEKYSTINKPISGGKTWQLIAEENQADRVMLQRREEKKRKQGVVVGKRQTVTTKEESELPALHFDDFGF